MKKVILFLVGCLLLSCTEINIYRRWDGGIGGSVRLEYEGIRNTISF